MFGISNFSQKFIQIVNKKLRFQQKYVAARKIPSREV